VSSRDSAAEATGAAEVDGKPEQVGTGKLRDHHLGGPVGASVVDHEDPIRGPALPLEREQAASQQLSPVAGDDDRTHTHIANTVTCWHRDAHS
jgi:hypothetical protein